MIEFQRVSKAYPGVGMNALSHVECTIARGEFVALLGASGAGKSTFLRLVAAIEAPSAGRVIVAGRDISRLPRHAVPFVRRNIGMTFQDQKLLARRSVLDNVALPLEVVGVARSEAVSRARAALDKVGLRDKEALLPAMLSGGEQQRVAIARAVVNRPAVLLADEPTANLDPEAAARVVRLFEDFQRVGVTIIVATHDPQLLGDLATRRLTLAQGCLKHDEPLIKEPS
ncbi:MAG TPA: ATP-binding cassette domain-containing protein [Burkholderiaceae bacterium]|nr:ATP-binding cassette domain-containing protein [Burkholderiaceae bacterium]